MPLPARSLFATLVAALLVVLTAAPGQAASYRLTTVSMPDGSLQVARWDSCRSITWKVSVRGVRDKAAQRRAVRVAKRGAARLADVSGLDLVFRGRTSEIPRRSTLGSQSADLLVGFVRPAQTDFPLSGLAAGYGGWRGGYARNAEGAWRLEITRGFVVVDHPQTSAWPDRLDRRGVTRANLLLHELGHAVGLGHVDAPGQLMHDRLHARTPAGYAFGDRRGLRKVGAAAGCLG